MKFRGCNLRLRGLGLSPNVSAGQQAVSVALPEDLTGYDAHMNSFAWKVAAGIAAIIAGVAVGVLLSLIHI